MSAELLTELKSMLADCRVEKTEKITELANQLRAEKTKTEDLEDELDEQDEELENLKNQIIKQKEEAKQLKADLQEKKDESKEDPLIKKKELEEKVLKIQELEEKMKSKEDHFNVMSEIRNQIDLERMRRYALVSTFILSKIFKSFHSLSLLIYIIFSMVLMHAFFLCRIFSSVSRMPLICVTTPKTAPQPRRTQW